MLMPIFRLLLILEKLVLIDQVRLFDFLNTYFLLIQILVAWRSMVQNLNVSLGLSPGIYKAI